MNPLPVLPLFPTKSVSGVPQPGQGSGAMWMRVSSYLPILFVCVSGIAMAAPLPEFQGGSIEDGTQVFDYDEALRISQSAIGNQLPDQEFISSKGNLVTLGQFHEKPLVLSMVYTSCHQICPMTTRHLSKVVDKAQDALGPDSFNVAVVGFDTPNDTPDAMQYFANKQGITNKAWQFLSISETDIQPFLDRIGFVYYPSSSGFDHVIQTTIIDTEGKVYRQVYGQVFETPLLVDPLIDLTLGQAQPADTLIENLGKKIKLFCTTYDPVRDGYYFDYSLFLGMIIGGTIIVITGFALMREHGKNKSLPHA